MNSPRSHFVLIGIVLALQIAVSHPALAQSKIPSEAILFKNVKVFDGVTEALWDQRIASTIATSDSTSAASDLVQLAVSESGRDNATALVIGIDQVEPRDAQ